MDTIDMTENESTGSFEQTKGFFSKVCSAVKTAYKAVSTVAKKAYNRVCTFFKTFSERRPVAFQVAVYTAAFIAYCFLLALGSIVYIGFVELIMQYCFGVSTLAL